jgi:hypothetical protein
MQYRIIRISFSIGLKEKKPSLYSRELTKLNTQNGYISETVDAFSKKLLQNCSTIFYI